jgi:hypothetical protein
MSLLDKTELLINKVNKSIFLLLTLIKIITNINIIN